MCFSKKSDIFNTCPIKKGEKAESEKQTSVTNIRSACQKSM